MLTALPGAPTRTVRRVTHPTHQTVPAILLYDVTPERHHKLTIASQAVYSVYVHLDGRRTLPCFGEAQCECERPELPLKRHHYLYVVAAGSPKLRLLRVTTGLVYHELPQLVEDGRDLRGEVIELWRAVPNKLDSAMLGKLHAEEKKPAEERLVPDIAWIVERMLTAPGRLKPWERKTERQMPLVAIPQVTPEERQDRAKEVFFLNTMNAVKSGVISQEEATRRLTSVGIDVGRLQP